MLNFNGVGIPIAITGGRVIYLDKSMPFEKIDENLICPYCNKKYSRIDVRKNHMKRCPKKDLYEFKKLITEHIQNGSGKDIILNTIDSSKEILSNEDVYPLPRTDLRNYTYVCGPSGSGKSYIIARLLEGYDMIFPEHQQFLFSRVNDDGSFRDRIGAGILNQIDIDDEELLEDPIDPKEELKKSVVVFDDIESMNPKVTAMLEGLREVLGLQSRDQANEGNDTYIITSNHLLTDYKRTRSILNEANAIICFPYSTSSYHLNRCLSQYFGLSKDEIKRVSTLPSRWVMVYRDYPRTVIYQGGVFIL